MREPPERTPFFVVSQSLNQDGCVDLYFRPNLAQGYEITWIKTNEGKPWFADFPWYGPLEA